MRLVTPVHLEKFPVEKSSEKIADPAVTWVNTNRPFDAQLNPSEAGLTSTSVPPTGAPLAKPIE